MAQHAGGLVVLDAVECTGCGACVEACPFGVIVLSPEGFASKCDGCPDELECGWEPTCVRACPLRALHYGATPDSGSLEARHLTVDAAFDGHGAGPAVVFLRRK
jgi:anaerobic dimethyl sulfoxide reductase subunit B (iron-sulfur subunit)